LTRGGRWGARSFGAGPEAGQGRGGVASVLGRRYLGHTSLRDAEGGVVRVHYHAVGRGVLAWCCTGCYRCMMQRGSPGAWWFVYTSASGVDRTRGSHPRHPVTPTTLTLRPANIAQRRLPSSRLPCSPVTQEVVHHDLEARWVFKRISRLKRGSNTARHRTQKCIRPLWPWPADQRMEWWRSSTIFHWIHCQLPSHHPMHVSPTRLPIQPWLPPQV
jgi:hypothetical protein